MSYTPVPGKTPAQPYRHFLSLNSTLKGSMSTLYSCISNQRYRFYEEHEYLNILLEQTFTPKCFILRREMHSISSRGPIETLSIYCFALGKVYWISKTHIVYRVFFARKYFIPRREFASQTPKGVQLFLLYILLV